MKYKSYVLGNIFIYLKLKWGSRKHSSEEKGKDVFKKCSVIRLSHVRMKNVANQVEDMPSWLHFY